MKQKKLLEDKLKGLDDQIKDLHHSVEPPIKTSPKAKKQIPTKAEQDKLRHQAEDFVHKMKEERLKRIQIEEERRANRQKAFQAFKEQRTSFNSDKKVPETSENQGRVNSREEKLNGGLSSNSSKAFVPLYKQWEMNSDELQSQELARRKRALAERRELYKPFKDKELADFGNKYQIDKKRVELKRHIESDDSKPKIQPVKKYDSKFLKQVLEQDYELKSVEEKKELEKKTLAEKRVQYGKNVKDMYLPKIDRQRNALLHENIKGVIDRAESMEKEDTYWKKKLKKPYKAKKSPKAIPKSDAEEDYQNYSSGGENRPVDQDYYGESGYSRGDDITPKNSEPQGRRESAKESELPRSQGYSVLKKKPSASGAFKITSKVEKKIPKSDEGDLNIERNQEEQVEDEGNKRSYPNYIEELKKKRAEYEKKGMKLKKQPWDKHLNNEKLSYAEKVNYVLDDVKSVEEVAKEKEMWIKKNAKVGNKDLKEEQDQVDDMYIDSIRAKIDVLGGAKS